MQIDMYWASLAVLGSTVLVAAGHGVVLGTVRGWRSGNVPVVAAVGAEENAVDGDAKRFRSVFLRVYLTVMASEWLQGPYTYSLFRNEKSLSESTVALLFVAYYSSAALSALFTGALADRFGRRAACLAFCVIHSLASITAFSNAIEILVAGRVLGGFALTLLWTAFESWMVAEYNARGLAHSCLSLPAMFGIMTTSNCITGILAGLLGHCIVLSLGSKTDPFALGVLLNISAVVMMLRTWNENHGTSAIVPEEGERLAHIDQFSTDDDEESNHIPNSTTSQIGDYKVWTLCFVSCCFEGTMFLLVFFWPSALQEAHNLGSGSDVDSDSIPHGVVQGTFMASMVLGALLFNTLTDYTGKSSGSHERFGGTSKLLRPTPLLCAALVLGSLGFLGAALCRDELRIFIVFLALEMCSGMYIPSMAYHRSVIVSDKHRTGTYGLMKIPLFLFVIGALCTTTGTDRAGHQQRVFLLCSALLLLASISTMLGLRAALELPGEEFMRVSSVDAHGSAVEDLLSMKSRVYATTTAVNDDGTE